MIDPGTICSELVDFTDFSPTIHELAGLALPDKIDGVSFAPLLYGKPADSPREWIFSLWQDNYIVRDQRFGMREDGSFFDFSDPTGKDTKVVNLEAMPEASQAQKIFLAALEQIEP